MIDRLKLTPQVRMILRRGFAALAVLGLVSVVGLAVLVATRDYAAIEREVIARLEQDSGAVFSFESKTQSFLPGPSLNYRNARFTRNDGTFSITAPELKVSIQLRDLLDGTVDGPVISLEKPKIQARIGKLDRFARSPRTISELADWISEHFDRPGRFKRLTVTLHEADLVLDDSGPLGAALDLGPADLQMRYSARRERIEFFAQRTKTNLPFDLAVVLPPRSALAGGKPRTASFAAAGLGSRIAFSGSARREPDLALVGKVELTLGDLLERLVLGEKSSRPMAIEPTAASANMVLDPRGIGLESLSVARQGRLLTGIAALREINGRWGLSATLAGDLVDGNVASMSLESLRATGNAWSAKPLKLNPLAGLDLDIRLSTKEFRLAALPLSNVALSILTRKGRAEYAIVDSKLGPGSFKARISVTDSADMKQDVKLMVSGEKLDMSSVLGQALGLNRISGTGTLVLQAEGRGASVQDIVGSLSGSGALDVKSGEVTGIDLQKLLARAGGSSADIMLVGALGGKTPFENLLINVALREGRIEPVGSTFVSAKVTASLEGTIELREQAHKLALILRRRVEEPGQPMDFFAFRMEGPLFAPVLKPDLRLLNRS